MTMIDNFPLEQQSETPLSEIILVVGGSRSGKSDFAQNYGERIPRQRYFIATCSVPPVTDQEMTARIDTHKQNRVGGSWLTMEEPLDLPSAIKSVPAKATIVVDCLTLWISNLLHAGGNEQGIDEETVCRKCLELLEVCRAHQGSVILVSSEVGCGIVPENALARHYRDLMGRCNQVIAAGADKVISVCCGIPTHIK